MTTTHIITAAVIVGVIVALLVTVWVSRQRRRARADSARARHDVSASRDMMGRDQIKQRPVRKPDKTVFGTLIDPRGAKPITDQLVMDDSDAPVQILGAPGSGKTIAMLAPSAIRHRGPALISTTKTDLAQTTIGARSAISAVAIVDPAEATSSAAGAEKLQPHLSVWTPITEGVTWDRAVRAADSMITAVAGAGNSGDNPFFESNSRTLVAALLVHLRATPGSSLVGLIEEVRRLAESSDQQEEDPWKALLATIRTQAQQRRSAVEFMSDEDAPAGRALATALETALLALGSTAAAATAPETRAGILGSVTQVMEGLLVAPRVMRQQWDAEDTLRLDVMPDMHTIYLICPRVDVRPLTNAFLGAYIEELQRRSEANGGALRQQHQVILDELVHCTPHRDLLSWTANVARSAKIKFLLCSQSQSDIIGVYGKENAASIRNACSGGHVLFSSTTDRETLEAAQMLAGKREMVQKQSVSDATTKSRNYSGHTKIGGIEGQSTSETKTVTKNVVEKDAATPARLAAMQTFHALVWLPGTPDTPGGTLQIRSIPLFEDPDLQAAARGDREAMARVRDLPDTSAWESPRSDVQASDDPDDSGMAPAA